MWWRSRSTVRATNVAPAPSASASGLNGASCGAERRRLRDHAALGGRRRLPLREPVDLVVEHQDLQRHVAAQRVDQVVAADRQRVAVAGHDPDREVVARGGEAGGERGRAAVDAVHPVRVHVVGEAAGAADAGHEHDPVRRDAELGHQLLDRRRAPRSRRSPGTSASPGRTLKSFVGQLPSQQRLDLASRARPRTAACPRAWCSSRRRRGTRPAAAARAGRCSSPAPARARSGAGSRRGWSAAGAGGAGGRVATAWPLVRTRRAAARIAPRLEPQPSTSSSAPGSASTSRRRRSAAMPRTLSARTRVMCAWLTPS